MKWSIIVLLALAAVCSANNGVNVAPPVTFSVPVAHVTGPVRMTSCTRPEECTTACETQCPVANVANCVNGQCNCGI